MQAGAPFIQEYLALLQEKAVLQEELSQARERLQDVTRERLQRKQLEDELRSSEERFRLMAETVPQIVWTVDRQGNTDYSNRRWSEYSGLSADQTQGSAWLDCIHPDHRELARASWRKAAASGAAYECEYLLRRVSDGEYRWHLSRAQPLRSIDGAIIKWVGSTTDIDDQKRQSTTLMEALRVRDEFLSIASHELKTPLTALKLQLEMAKHWVGTDPSHALRTQITRMLDASDRQIDSLTGLINDLMDLSQIQAGALKLRPERLDLAELVRNALDRLSLPLAVSGCKLELIEKGSVSGNWDRQRLDQVIVNLLTNALKYGMGKPVVIRVDSLDGLARLSVRDQGVGIASENHLRIFERYERCEGDSGVRGLGLGLYIAQQMVSAHRGRIWVESKLGSGSVFRVDLPMNLTASSGPTGRGLFALLSNSSPENPEIPAGCRRNG